MNYQHSYHAGNFADAFKHIVLVALLQPLLRKDNPFIYLDTHAGSGAYDLLSDAAKKNKEYKSGISPLLTKKAAPPLIQEYLEIVQAFNPSKTLRYYPGSPAIARHFLRENDRMLLSELEPASLVALHEKYGHDTQTHIHHMDGYQSLKAFLPPKERRGLILIDPPYEKPNELETIKAALITALKRFETGIYAIWYPIKDRPPIERFHRELKAVIQRPMLAVELSIYAEISPLLLSGSGLIIVNPPWQFDEQMQSCLPWLSQQLGVKNQGSFRLISL